MCIRDSFRNGDDVHPVGIFEDVVVGYAAPVGQFDALVAYRKPGFAGEVFAREDVYKRQAVVRPEVGDFAYGCFMSGPSKTADIEQALVFGADVYKRQPPRRPCRCSG